MHEQILQPGEPFIVRESRSVNYVFGSLLLVVFIVSCASGQFSTPVYISMLILLGIPAAAFFFKGSNRREMIRVDDAGFFYYGRLITGWEQFHDIRLFEKTVPGSIQDQFYILVRYMKAGRHELYGRRLRTSNTQDKGDEEIIAAVRYFYQRMLTAKEAAACLRSSQ